MMSFLFFVTQMTARSVLLANAVASFLRGEEPLRAGGCDHSGHDGDGESLAQRWRECDQRAQLSLASANPQVSQRENIIEILKLNVFAEDSIGRADCLTRVCIKH